MSNQWFNGAHWTDTLNDNFTYFLNFLTQNENQVETDRIKTSIAISFDEKYYPVKFEMLKKQTDDIVTKDCSTHYLYEATGQIYSWNNYTKSWVINSPMYCESLKEHLRF